MAQLNKNIHTMASNNHSERETRWRLWTRLWLQPAAATPADGLPLSAHISSVPKPRTQHLMAPLYHHYLTVYIDILCGKLRCISIGAPVKLMENSTLWECICVWKDEMHHQHQPAAVFWTTNERPTDRPFSVEMRWNGYAMRPSWILNVSMTQFSAAHKSRMHLAFMGCPSWDRYLLFR